MSRREMATRICLCSPFLTTVVSAMVACGWSVSMETRLMAQESEIPSRQDVSEATRSPRNLPILPHAVVDKGTAYVCWPESLVGELTITAMDLTTLDVRWKRSFEGESVNVCRPVGEIVFCRTTGNDVTHEWLLRKDSGEVINQHEIPENDQSHRFRTPYVGGRYLVAGRVYDIVNGKTICDLGYAWTHAFVQGEKLYTIERRHADERGNSDVPRHAGRRNVDRKPREDILRRLDLTSASTELTVVLQSASPFRDDGLSYDLIAASGDRVVLQTNRSNTLFERNKTLRCFDMVRDTELWASELPCELRNARFRDSGQLECLPRCREGTYGTSADESQERRALLVDFETGVFRPDPDWFDSFSIVAWHSGLLPIVNVQRVNGFTIAMLEKRPPNYRRELRASRDEQLRGGGIDRKNQANLPTIICLESASGRLVWIKQLDSLQPCLVDDRNEKLVRMIPSGVQIIDVATGADRIVNAGSVGFMMVPEIRQTQQISIEPAPQIPAVKYDDMQDRLLLGLPVVPLVIWGAYQLFRWQRGRFSKSTISS